MNRSTVEGTHLPRTNSPSSWVVYQMTIRGVASGTHAVCDQREWEEIERTHPGYHHLVQQGIATEGEAERLARTVPIKANASEAAPQNLLADDDDSDAPLE